MANANIMLPSLFGGTSTQAPALRFPNQVESATNALMTVNDGLELRPGTVLNFAIGAAAGSGVDQDLVTGRNYRMHTIKRDSTEKYLVVYGGNIGGADNLVLRVFEPSNAVDAECTVDCSADALTYLGANDATADQLRMVTVADYTLILNTTVPVATTAFTQYAITGTHRDYDTLLAHTPADDTYHKTKESTASEVKGYYHYVLTGGSYPTWHRSAEKFTQADFKDSTWNPGGFKVGMARLPLIEDVGGTGSSWNLSTMTLTTTNLVMTHTHQTGDQLYITGGTGMVTGWYTISSMPTTSSLVLATSPGASTNDVEHDAIGHEYSVTVNMETDTLNDMYDVAQRFQDALRADGCTNGLIEWVETDTGKGYFVITGNWPGGATAVYYPTKLADVYNYTNDGVGGGGDHPFANTAATSVAGAGGASGTTTPESRWTKVPPPGDPDSVITPTTMPVKMVRTSVSAGDVAAVFTIDVIDWTDRLSGGELTNPVTSIFENDRKINDITFHRNRLWLMGGENIVSSQAGDYFNLYIEDAENIGDADPIDTSLSSEKVTIGDFIVPFRKTLLVLSQAGAQFELNAPELLTPNTATITPTTMYNTLSVRPDTIGLRVYMACTVEDGTQLREYFFSDSAAAADAPDVSSHARGYLPTTVRTLRACPNDDTVLLLPSDRLSLYVYRTMFDGSKRIQSSWGKYNFTGLDRIDDIGIIDSRCYMLVEDTDGFRMASFPVSQELPPTGYNYGLRLDAMVSHTGVYNAGTGRTTWTLAIPDSSLDRAVVAPSTELTLVKVDASTYWASGNYSASAAWLGARYQMEVELSKPYRRDQNGAALLDSVMQMVKLTLNHQNSGPYSLRIVQPLNRSRGITYTPSTNPEEEGRANFYILGNAKDTDLTIIAYGPKPVAISAGELAVTFNQLSR